MLRLFPLGSIEHHLENVNLKWFNKILFKKKHKKKT